MPTLYKTGRFIWGKWTGWNSVTVLDGDFVSKVNGAVVKTTAWVDILWVAAWEQTFTSDNETVAKKQLQYISIDDYARYKIVITGGTITESGANYAVISVATVGTVTLIGLVYVVTDKLYSEYLPADPNRKDNIIKISDATLVNSSNGATVCSGLYDYYQQRYQQKMKLFSPASGVRVGATVNAETLYGNSLYGVIERMTTNLFGGNVADTEVVGIIL